MTWLHRGEAAVGSELVGAVKGLEFPVGDVHAFVHGEAGFVKELRGCSGSSGTYRASGFPSPGTGAWARTTTAGAREA